MGCIYVSMHVLHVCATSEVFLYGSPLCFLICLTKPGACISSELACPAKPEIHLLSSTLALGYWHYRSYLTSAWVMEG